MVNYSGRIAMEGKSAGDGKERQQDPLELLGNHGKMRELKWDFCQPVFSALFSTFNEVF